MAIENFRHKGLEELFHNGKSAKVRQNLQKTALLASAVANPDQLPQALQAIGQLTRQEQSARTKTERESSLSERKRAIEQEELNLKRETEERKGGLAERKQTLEEAKFVVSDQIRNLENVI